VVGDEWAELVLEDFDEDGVRFDRDDAKAFPQVKLGVTPLVCPHVENQIIRGHVPDHWRGLLKS